MTDPTADMLSRIRNAQAARKATVKIPFSQLRFAVAQILVKEGFLKQAERKGKSVKKYIECELRYSGKMPVIEGLRRVSMPSRRIYRSAAEMVSPKYGYGIIIVSTSKGIMTDKEARRQKTGGEVLCEVW